MFKEMSSIELSLHLESKRERTQTVPGRSPVRRCSWRMCGSYVSMRRPRCNGAP